MIIMYENLTELQQKQFFDDGYIILKDFFSNEELQKIETAFVRMYAIQASKILEYRKKLDKGTNFLEYSTVDDLIKILELLEEKDKEALYQVQRIFSQSHFIKEFYLNQKLINIASQLLDCPKEIVLFDDLGLLINRPSTKRLLYKWHTEVSFYPKRQNFLNVYFPVFFDKNLKNGHMIMAKKSHKLIDIPFIEYQGYDVDSIGKKNYFVQYEVPSSIAEKFERVTAVTKRGDVVLFERNLLHMSTPNITNQYSFASVCRIWEPTQDLTLSGEFRVKPYNNDFGRPGIDKIPKH